MPDETKERAEQRGFVHGLAFAAAHLARDRRVPYEAAILIAESGVRLEEFRQAKTPGYDMRVISRLFRTENYLKRAGE